VREGNGGGEEWRGTGSNGGSSRGGSSDRANTT